MATFVPFILAGGRGQRFWPLSRGDHPKQFLALDRDGRSLLRLTADRVDALSARLRYYVITSESQAARVRQELPEIAADAVLVEPEARDTAPAVAWATKVALDTYGEDTIVGVFPSDHHVGRPAAFAAAVHAAVAVARDRGEIVTLGIKPTRAATGYGYIERGERVGVYDDHTVYRVLRFTEKPAADQAEMFIADPRYSWNSGIFIFPAAVMRDELKRHAPELVDVLNNGPAGYATAPKLSLDYALMEHTDAASVLLCDFDWDDLGDWTALARLAGGGRNYEHGRHIHVETRGCIVYTTDERELVATIGLEDLVIVRDGPYTLVARKDRLDDLKLLLKRLPPDAL